MGKMLPKVTSASLLCRQNQGTIGISRHRRAIQSSSTAENSIHAYFRTSMHRVTGRPIKECGWKRDERKLSGKKVSVKRTLDLPSHGRRGGETDAEARICTARRGCERSRSRAMVTAGPHKFTLRLYWRGIGGAEIFCLWPLAFKPERGRTEI
jgi:hypothetical protein